MNIIHKTAIIYDNVELGDGNTIGAYCVIGSPAQVRGNKVKGKVIIGNNNLITNHVTIDASKRFNATVIGNNIMIMSHVHIGGDCRISDNCNISSSVTMGGGCIVKNNTFLGMGSILHQRSYVGSYVMVGAGCFVKGIIQDYLKICGVPYRIIGINTLGLKRAGFTEKEINEIRLSHKNSTT